MPGVQIFTLLPPEEQAITLAAEVLIAAFASYPAEVWRTPKQALATVHEAVAPGGKPEIILAKRVNSA
jgi:hypothetical protein